MSLCIQPKMNQVVQNKLNEYLYGNLRHTQAILDRMVFYFPMIERKLRQNGMPEDLKYLVIVESQIDPLAESTDGALGLWQLMPNTAKSLGLTINNYIDERRDPEQSTEAAIRYLKMLYAKFDNWELTLSAYNGGAARIKRAQRKCNNSKDFWKIKKCLPKESADFISRFTAAAYLGIYYKQHFFQKPKINPDFHLTTKTIIKKHMPFAQIAKKTNIPVYVLMELNPMYKKSYIPASTKGNYVTLPKRVAQRLNTADKPKVENATHYDPQKHYDTIIYIADKHESVYQIAKKLDTDPFLIKYWNHMDKLLTLKKREIIVYKPK